MKLLPTLVVSLWFAAPAFSQGVRMAADFLPLQVGNRWIYTVSDEAGRKTGELDFAVEDYRIVSGTSFYVLTEFPFTGETGSRIRMIRYDRQERQFMRVNDGDEGPLFLSDGATTEVLATDPAGSPVKFVLRMDSLALTFERGVGIVEARFQTSNGPRVAKIAGMEGKSLAAGGNAAAAASTPSKSSSPVSPSVPLPPPGPQVRRAETITPVTETNPRLDIYSTPSPSGHTLAFVVENIFDKLLPFRFSSGQTYDFVVRDPASGREVWRWSRDQVFTQVIRSEAIRGNGKWTFETIWNARDNDGQPVSSGQYYVIGILTSDPPIQSPPAVIAIP